MNRLKRRQIMFGLVEKYKTADMPKREFCVRHHIKLHTFTWWQRIFRKENKGSVPAVRTSPAFIPVKGPVDLLQSGYEYRFQDGNRLIIPGTKAIQDVVALIKGLQGISCSR